MRQLHIVLADEQSQVLHFLKMFPEPKYDVVGVVRDRQDLVTAAIVLKPDIVIIDIDMPGLTEISAIRQLRNIAPDCRVIVKSAHGDPNTMAEAYTAGVSAYLVKEPSLSFTFAIRAIIDQPQWTKEWKTATTIEQPDLTTYGCNMGEGRWKPLSF
jgi:DNA-binding NarL/FixJ family response regulator